MVNLCVNFESLKKMIADNKYCVVLLAKTGCTKCKPILEILNKVYRIYPSITYIQVEPTIAVNLRHPLKVFALTTIFYKDGIEVGMIKNTYSEHSYVRNIRKLLEK